MNIINGKLRKPMVILLIMTLLLTSGAFATACSDDSNAQRVDIVFDDVSPDDWFYRYVEIGLRFGIVQGAIGNGLLWLEPNRRVTRLEFITMLGRLHEYGDETFGTLDEEAFYERYFDWAVENGLIQGNEHGDLMPNAYITREQVAVIINRYITAFELWSYFDYAVPVVAMSFLDEDTSDWARGSIEMLRVHHIAFGEYGHIFRSNDLTIHAEALQMLARIGSAIYDLRHPLWTRVR